MQSTQMRNKCVKMLYTTLATTPIMNSVEIKIIDNKLALADDFNHQLLLIIRTAESKLPSTTHEIKELMEIIKIAKSIDPCILIDKCAPKIWSLRDAILKRDEKFLLDFNYSVYVKQDENQRFIETLIMLIKNGQSMLTTDEKKWVWDRIAKLLLDVIEYKKLRC